MHGILKTATAAMVLCMACAGVAQGASRLRGTIGAIDGAGLHITPRAGGGETVVALAPDARITLVSPTALSAVTPGSFIGTAAKTLADGTMVAMEVHVFPESMRGSGEGSRPFDLGPGSTMTNGTVAQQVVAQDGQTLTVRYKDGQKSIQVPPGVPVVALSPGDRSLLAPGAHVVAFVDDAGAARTVLVGKDGLVPPM